MNQPMQGAVIGCGEVGRLHAEGILRSRRANLVGVCDKDARAAGRMATITGATPYTSLDSLLHSQRLDFVTVATPDKEHREAVQAAIERGLHVFCEKPLASSYEDAVNLTRAAEHQGVQLGVDYNRRFGFGYAVGRELCLASTSASPGQVTLHVSDGIPEKVVAQPFALLTSLVSHHVDLLRWFGGEFHAVHAVLRGPDPSHPHHAAMILEHCSGLLGSLQADWIPGQTRTSERFRWISDAHEIVIDDVQREVQIWSKDPDSIQTLRPNPFELGNRFYDTIIAHVIGFVQAIGTHSPVPVTGHDACITLQIIEAAMESNRTGKRILITQTQEESPS